MYIQITPTFVQESQEGGASLEAAEATPSAPVERRDRRETYAQLPADQLIAYLGGLGTSGWVMLYYVIDV